MSFGILGIANTVELNLNANSVRLDSAVKQLSSGLRINSALDDPSGLALSEHSKSISLGLEEGQRQVQNANNALTVADGALATISEILQRMRTLVVQANSDIVSTEQKTNIQSELDQLTLEINRISQNTNFNGQHLLDGSLSGNLGIVAHPVYIQNPSTDAGPPLIDPTSVLVSPTAQQIQFSFTVNSFDAPSGQLTVTLDASSPDPSFGPEQVNSFQVAENTNFPTIIGFPTPITIQDQFGNPVLQFNFNNIDRNDVGESSVIATIPTQNDNKGHALEVNVGRAEGDVVTSSIDAATAVNLGVNQIQVGSLLANQAAEARVDNALSIINAQRGAVGSQEIALQAAGENAGTQDVAEVAAGSAIRDANIGQQTTELAKAQILTQLGTTLLSQVATDARLTAQLVTQTFAASSPASTSRAH
ncbi:MAG: flagellin [Candidatus Eremiobacteraeota bacterium]|nr:flagellin [Candidatus Eremiobacteraeota bacterium]